MKYAAKPRKMLLAKIISRSNVKNPPTEVWCVADPLNVTPTGCPKMSSERSFFLHTPYVRHIVYS